MTTKKPSYKRVAASNSFMQEELEAMWDALHGRGAWAPESLFRPQDAEILERLAQKAFAGGDVVTVVKNPQFRELIERIKDASTPNPRPRVAFTEAAQNAARKIKAMLARIEELRRAKTQTGEAAE